LHLVARQRAQVGFEKDPVLIHKSDKGAGGIKNLGRQPGYLIECFFGRRIQDTEPVQLPEPVLVIDGNDGGWFLVSNHRGIVMLKLGDKKVLSYPRGG
jgi:hypothetical protein